MNNFISDRNLLFGLLALILACVGLYGVTAYSVARRTSEIGIRMALGADRASVLGLVLRGAMLQLGLGLALGIPVALAMAKRHCPPHMALILNILWFIFGGFISGLAWLLAGVLLAITIVGLPWSAAAFRIAGFSFAPFGRHVVPRRALNGRDDLGTGAVGFLGNVIWVVIAGWWLGVRRTFRGPPVLSASKQSS